MAKRQNTLLNFVCKKPKVDILENKTEEEEEYDFHTFNKPENIATFMNKFEIDIYNIEQYLNTNFSDELKYK